MAKAKKLPSGNWNIRAYSHKDENGKAVYISFTAETKAECEYKYAEWKINRKANERSSERTVRDAVEKYIELSEPFLQVTTIEAYKQYMRYGFQDLLDTPISKLNNNLIQAEINKESNRIGKNKTTPISPKMVKNEWSVIASALKAEGLAFWVRLPKCQKDKPDLPEPQEVLSAVYDTEIWLPCLLAMCCSLRLGEIRGLKCSSIRRGFLHVTQTKVFSGGRDVLKDTAKTPKSKRGIELIDIVKDAINQSAPMQKYKKTGVDGFLVPMPESTLRHLVYKYMVRAGLDLSIHDLRHIFASVDQVKLAINSKITEVDGGWDGDATMDETYTHAFIKERHEATIKRNEFYNPIYKEIKQNMKRRNETKL